jgi:murein DD-endopeptidase MepM/ murein hydrolase activator NlpD
MDHHPTTRTAVSLLAGPLLLLIGPGGETAPPSGTPSAPRVAAASPFGPPPGARDASPHPAHGTSRRPRWRWPVDPRPPVLRPFVAPASRWGPGHRGLDLSVAAGAEVAAVEGGVVTHAGRVAGRGTVTVAHPGGLASTYEPVRARVLAGTTVEPGSVLGVVEAPAAPPAVGHCLLHPCLHLGARRGEAYLDPMLLLRPRRVRLLPLGTVQPRTG